MSKKGMIFIIIIIVLTVVFGLWSSSLWATDYYCDPVAGDIGNNGLTPETAWPRLSTTWDSKVGSTVTSGDTIYLMNGYNGHIDKNQSFENTDYITIEPADGHTASLAKFCVEGGEYWHLKNLIISPDADGNWNSVGILVKLITHGVYGTAHHNIIENCTIYSKEDWSGWTLEEFDTNVDTGIKIGSYGTVKNCTIYAVEVGITTSGGGQTVQYNTINYFTIDGIDIGSCDNSTYEYNTIQGVVDYAPEEHHHDGIQLIYAGTVDNLIIRGNKVFNLFPGQTFGVGSCQGINCFQNYTHTGWSVVNNVVVVNHTHGMTIDDLVGSEIVNNTIVKDSWGSNVPGIKLENSSNTDVINNITHSWSTPGGGSIVSNNYDADSYTLTDEFVDYTNYNVSLKSTSNFVNVGTTTQAPSIDVDQNPRDLSPDVGAYEYQGKYFIVIED